MAMSVEATWTQFKYQAPNHSDIAAFCQCRIAERSPLPETRRAADPSILTGDSIKKIPVGCAHDDAFS